LEIQKKIISSMQTSEGRSPSALFSYPVPNHVNLNNMVVEEYVLFTIEYLRLFFFKQLFKNVRLLKKSSLISQSLRSIVEINLKSFIFFLNSCLNIEYEMTYWNL